MKLCTSIALAFVLTACATTPTTRDSGADAALFDGDASDGHSETGDDGAGEDRTAPPRDAAMPGLDRREANARCLAWARPRGRVEARRVFSRLSFRNPVLIRQAPGDRSRFFVVEKIGVVQAFNNLADPERADVFVDLRDRVDAGPNEAGLLGLAFHPRFATNGQVFLSYTARVSGRLVSRLSRFASRDGGRTVDRSTETVLIAVEQPYDNHNGGMIEFGPDGMLYYALGDGGAGGDPMGNGQRLNTLLGKILRVDVDGTSPGLAYRIPDDNPFRTMAGARGEIWAYGLRNPWRFSFDRETSALWAGDVGQNAYEEIDIIERGRNYGWNTMEGLHCYPSGDRCARDGLALPVHEYPRSDGVSITGGYVYRGSLVPSLRGQYLFGDFGTGTIWALAPSPTGAYTRSTVATGVGQLSSFGEDIDGELYVLEYNSGRVLQLVAGAATEDATPTTLSATGCVDMSDPSRPLPGVIAYDVNAPLWSDGAEKERFFALPDGARITVQSDGDLELPVGSVTIKSFVVDGRRVETRLMVRHEDGDWAGYTYAWNEAGTDATLLRGGGTRTVRGVSWVFPSEAQCLQCHSTSSGRTLGLEAAQLNRAFTYVQTGRTANQLETLDAIGLFTTTLASVHTARALAAYDSSSASLEDRARAYLHANCAHCHRPGGTGRGAFDLRFYTPFASSGLCGVAAENDLSIAGAQLVLPGDPARSVVSRRLEATDATRMPPVGVRVTDTAGVTLVDGFIRSLMRCP